MYCKHCGSTRIVKNGVRNGRQYWLCLNCRGGFVANLALLRGKYEIDVISLSVDLFFKGTNNANIREKLGQMYGLNPTDGSIGRWARRFSKIANKEFERHTANIGDAWTLKETACQIHKSRWWIINVVDTRTNLMLAQMLSKNMTNNDITLLLEAASIRGDGLTPRIIYSDGWKPYHTAIESAFGIEIKHVIGSQQGGSQMVLFSNLRIIQHKLLKHIRKPENAMELLQGMMVDYNLFRRQQSLNGKTPSEAAEMGCRFGQWLDVVRSQQ
jgi:transposase-like protein